ncbi:MAG: alcohol dehydrogenase catalytic domain-containing protein [Gemmatimonadota bacterium]
MQGVWLEDRRLALREDLPLPDPGPREALVRVLRAGICNTDLELLRGYSPFTGIPGHEFVGVVERGPEALVGRRVVGEINVVCGACEACRAGRRTHCERRSAIGISGRDGAFAEYLALPPENLHAVPDGVTTDAATFAEPLAAALRIEEQVPLAPGDRILVVGPGKLGQLVARALAARGLAPLVLGRSDGKLKLLARVGIATTREIPEPGSVDVAVDCTGSPDGFGIAREALRAGGILVLKSTYAGSLTLDASRLAVDEITIVGSRCGPFPPALELLATGAVDVEPLIQARFPLREALAAYEAAAAPGTLKILLRMD